MHLNELMLQKLQEITIDSSENAMCSRAPGRVEVLGNHTDYNGGLVLAATIDRFVWSLAVPSNDVVLYSMDFKERTEFPSQGIEPTPTLTWESYVRGVFWALERRKHKINGLTGVIHGDVPIGAGLSSSAALEVSLVNLALRLNHIKVNPKSAAMLAFEAERLYCGVSCGVMDQFTSQLGKEDSLLGIRCTSLQTEDIPLDSQLKLIISDSKVSRAAGEVLNKRRLECQKALAVLREGGWDIRNLSDIRKESIENINEYLGETLARRVRHVVLENARVDEGIQALRSGNLTQFGLLMEASHKSSKDLYEVSHDNLDLLVEIARSLEGVIGSRLTGAGLGGATITLAREKDSTRIAETITQRYEKETGITPEVMVTGIPGGVK
ncbi:MAG: galactokinase, partial [Candidatus Hodarchaeota archaeon]